MPDLEHVVTLETGYGILQLTGRDAAQVAALVRRLLETRLRTAERRSARPEP